MSLNNVKAKNVDGAMHFYDETTGTDFVEFDAPNLTVSIPTGASLDIESGGALKIAGTDRTAGLAAVAANVAGLNALNANVTTLGVINANVAKEVALVANVAGLNALHNNEAKLDSLATNVTTLNAAVAGVAANYKAARGTATLDGANPTSINTGLTTVTGFTANLKTNAAPALDPTQLTVEFGSPVAAGFAEVYAWKVTSNTDPTLIASENNTVSISWTAFGT